MVGGKPVCDDNWGMEEVKMLQKTFPMHLNVLGNSGVQSVRLGSCNETHKRVSVWQRQ